ncbi:Cupredoxin [Parasponia andersonii]|uniref:Cupredoxin n=1 Tax=Parasponia andersonii TaxID=3476 RepID=A0A2P5CQA6_PARAD|nr:Cupredoxin [Parasponia andersonii]
MALRSMVLGALILELLTAAVLLLSQIAQAKEFLVGEKMCWTIPPGGAATYASWASNITFVVGDTLDYYYVSTLPNNCAKGQKLAIRVAATASSGVISPAQAPSAAHAEAPALPAELEPQEKISSASSFAATFHLIFSSVATSFLCQF